MKSFIIILISYSCSLFAQIQPAIPDFLISGDDNIPSTLSQSAPQLTQLNSANFLVTWHDTRDGSSYYSQRFDKNGNKVNKNFKLEGQRGYLEEDGSLLAIQTDYWDWFDEMRYETYAKVFNPQSNLLQNNLVYSGVLPWCGTGYIPGEELVAGSDENFFYLSNEGGVLRLVKMANDGMLKEYDHVQNLQYITHTALAASENSTLLYAWLKGDMGYYYPEFTEEGDSLKTGIYVSIISQEDSVIVPALLVKELNEQPDLWEYIGNYEFEAIALNNSLFKLFWVKKGEVKIYSALINNRGQIAGGIDSLVLDSETNQWGNISINLTNKDQTCFYIHLRGDSNNDIIKEWLLRYNLNGDYTGDIHSGEFTYPHPFRNLFNSGNGILYGTWSDATDAFFQQF